MTDLSKLKCIPCSGDVPALDQAEIEQFQSEVPDWDVITENGIPRLRRTYKFKDFAQALAFTNRVGAAAEEEDHHPTLLTSWGKVTVTWWTHVIKGLHRNDFIMAARTDELYTG